MQEEFRAITIIELRQLKGDLELLWHRHYFEQKDAAMRKLFKRYLLEVDVSIYFFLLVIVSGGFLIGLHGSILGVNEL